MPKDTEGGDSRLGLTEEVELIGDEVERGKGDERHDGV